MQVMKILTATSQTQGTSPLDFHWCNEGEILAFGFECDGGTWDDHCGCRRSLCGIKTHKASTTFMVKDSPFSPGELQTLFATSLVHAGWYRSVSEETVRHAEELVDEVRQIADHFPTGSILERRDNSFLQRRLSVEVN